MPLIRQGEAMPGWCALRRYQRWRLAGGERRRLPALAEKARLIVTAGRCLAGSGGHGCGLGPSQFVDLLPGDDAFFVRAYDQPCEVMVLHGTWGGLLGGCGVFTYSADTPGTRAGDAVTYPKATNFDSHYHDCDEYWLLLEGRCEAVVGATHLLAGPGDCVAIGMGHHHDLARIMEPIQAVYFETTLEGSCRLGHLWTHTHGPAVPHLDRV